MRCLPAGARQFGKVVRDDLVNAFDLFLSIVFTGTAYAMILYIISVGLSITMGLLGIVNLAHGAFAMAGGYLVIDLMTRLAIPFFPSLLLAAILVGCLSIVLERLVYARVYDRGEFDQVLLTIGLIFVSIAIAHFFYGPLPTVVETPSAFQGNVDFWGRSLSAYRLFLIAFGLVTFLSLLYTIERTGIGTQIRATVDNRPMAQSVGINTSRLFSIVFAVGSGLAAVGGALGGELIALTPGYPLEQLVYFLIVVSIGGQGNVKGPFAAALLLGIGDTACKMLAPQFGAFFIYTALFVILLLRPQGLFARA